MATVPATRTWVAGEVVLDTHFNTNIRDVLNFLLARPIFQGRQTSAQSLTSGTFAAITMDAEDVDSASGHSTVTNAARYTAVYAGWATLTGSCGYAANATGRRLTKWRMNGTTDLTGSGIYVPATAANVAKVPAVTMKAFFNVNEYAELMAAQESGGALNTAVSGNDQPTFGYQWEGN